MKGLIKQGKVKVLRTREGTIFEIIGGLMVLVMWALALWVCLHSGAGEAGTAALQAGDKAADIVYNLVVCALGTFVVVLSLASAYHPDTMVNIPVRVSSAEGWSWVTRMVRVLALELALLFMATILDVALQMSPILTIATSAVLIITLVVFCVVIARKR